MMTINHTIKRHETLGDNVLFHYLKKIIWCATIHNKIASQGHTSCSLTISLLSPMDHACMHAWPLFRFPWGAESVVRFLRDAWPERLWRASWPENPQTVAANKGKIKYFKYRYQVAATLRIHWSLDSYHLHGAHEHRYVLYLGRPGELNPCIGTSRLI